MTTLTPTDITAAAKAVLETTEFRFGTRSLRLWGDVSEEQEALHEIYDNVGELLGEELMEHAGINRQLRIRIPKRYKK